VKITVTLGLSKFAIGDQETVTKIAAYLHDCGYIQYVQGCERCLTVCVSMVAKCRCCLDYSVSRAFPTDGKGHVRLLSREDFVKRSELMRGAA
jgi:hypothetical protein